MRLGIFTPVTDEQTPPAELARQIEDRGFESLFVPEHSHIPTRFATPTPDGNPISRDYYRNLDPFVTLTAAAVATTRLRLGTSVLLVPQRDPIHLAKEVASLDLVSGGRAELGAGAGWLREEMRNHGTDPATRFALLTERLAAVKTIWAGPGAEFHGELVDFDPIEMWPKPVQTPHPPVWLGGWGPTTLGRVVSSGSGWLAPPGLSMDELARGIKELAELADARAVPTPLVVATLYAPTPHDLDAARELGVHRVLLGLTGAISPGNTRRGLDAYAGLLP
ncbi:LLM class F420-dependent oxidoreductase [Kineosporia sp. J2-2]|uniref:LLM class F420-dependent oxidoreductase n=1 Tax=Kineosporia corallincola TaxID=2835133 RepID=A0ABS5TQS6_9ACTN|nr:LLM class F420-dependent oxidoreductase [Kineosporia corallincola]MBT0772603.1 LLM class F420-dependent oxidoreductase [Kineosporia corallincola]